MPPVCGISIFFSTETVTKGPIYKFKKKKKKEGGRDGTGRGGAGRGGTEHAGGRAIEPGRRRGLPVDGGIPARRPRHIVRHHLKPPRAKFHVFWASACGV